MWFVVVLKVIYVVVWCGVVLESLNVVVRYNGVV